MHLLVNSSSTSKAVLLVRNFCGLKNIKAIPASSEQAPTLVNGPICFHSTIAITKSLVHLGNRSELLGITAEDAAFVEQWLIIASRLFYTDHGPSPKLLDNLNSQFLSSVYLVGNQITLADVILYAALHSSMKNIIKKNKFLNLCRWFDHIYHTSAHLDTTLPEIPFYIPSTIFQSSFTKSLSSNEKKNKGKGKKAKGSSTESKQNAGSEKKKQQKKNDKQQNKKEVKNKDAKKEKKKKKPKSKPAGPDNSWRLNVVVGKINSARKHKTEGDRMFVSEIDCGEEKCRTVVMGVASFCKEEDLNNRFVMVIINIKAGDFKGEFSNGRVLVATSSDGTKKEIVKIPDGAKIGERIKVGNMEKPPDGAISNKNMHKILKQLHTSSKGVAQYADFDFLTSAGPCISTITDGTLA